MFPAGDADLGQAGAIRIYSLSSSSLLRTISNAAYRWRKSGNNLFQEGKQFKITEDGAYIVGVVKVTSSSATANRNKLSVWRISDGAWMGSVDSQTNGNSDTEWAYGGGVVTPFQTRGWACTCSHSQRIDIGYLLYFLDYIVYTI